MLTYPSTRPQPTHPPTPSVPGPSKPETGFTTPAPEPRPVPNPDWPTSPPFPPTGPQWAYAGGTDTMPRPSPQPTPQPSPSPKPAVARRSFFPSVCAYAALAIVAFAALLVGYTTQPPTKPAAHHIRHVRPATPVESLTHRLEAAYEMDRILAGR